MSDVMYRVEFLDAAGDIQEVIRLGMFEAEDLSVAEVQAKSKARSLLARVRARNPIVDTYRLVLYLGFPETRSTPGI
jgi:hypothetical protein